MFIFFISGHIFRNLKLEIAFAIPASNDEKYNWNNSAGQGLRDQCWNRVTDILNTTVRKLLFVQLVHKSVYFLIRAMLYNSKKMFSMMYNDNLMSKHFC